MKCKLIFTVFTALFISFSCTTHSSNDTENTLLWRISGNGLEKPSYLFGTHHLIPVSFLDSIPGIASAFDNTKQVIGEFDMTNMSEMQSKIMRESMLPEEVSYGSLLPPGDVALVDSMLKALVGVGFDQLGRFKPAFLSNIISISFYQQYYPSAVTDKNLDQYFQDEALARSRPVIGLETDEEQIQLLLNLQSLERQAEMLVCTVRHPELLKKNMDELQKAYHAQDLKAIREIYEKIPDDPCPSTDGELNAMNSDRNKKWLEKIPALMKENPSFIAVGCLHLTGDDGLIVGLRELGYKVEAITKQ